MMVHGRDITKRCSSLYLIIVFLLHSPDRSNCNAIDMSGTSGGDLIIKKVLGPLSTFITTSRSAETKDIRVRVIYTGGTIGMVRNEDNVLVPSPKLVDAIRKYPNMHDQNYTKGNSNRFVSKSQLVLPVVQGHRNRVLYELMEYETPLDSSNMDMNDWEKIAKDIKLDYNNYDGFVILHGTDTMAFTASALSFMLENLGKSVVITGSQIPIFETRTDGMDNFISALIIAGYYVIPEVCVFFGGKLMRGSRTTKYSSEALEAFDSPNMPPLARVSLTVNIDEHLIIPQPSDHSKFDVHSRLEKDVGILRIFPGISTYTFRAFLAPPMKGVVLQAFGAGNVPANRQDLLRELKNAVDRGVIIMIVTQCPAGSVADLYETGKAVTDLGALSGYDMTSEAALTKLSYVLAKNELSLDMKKQMMTSNLRGELTPNPNSELPDNDYVSYLIPEK